MSILTRKNDSNLITFKGVEMAVNVSFDNVLKLFELEKDKMFEPSEKLIITMKMLVPSYHELDIQTWEEVGEIVDACFKLLNKKSSPTGDKKLIDFDIDAERIYSSFLKEYDIDLREEQGRLSWQKFIALLNTLSDETPVMKAIGYRAMEIPPEVKGKERARLLKLKQLYELPSQADERNEALLAYMDRRRSTLESR